VAVSDNSLAYLAGGGSLTILNVTDPRHPTPWGFFDVPPSPTVVQYSGRIAASGDLLYLPSGTNGLWILRATRPWTAASRWTLYDSDAGEGGL
jgi:hypothetical protein